MSITFASIDEALQATNLPVRLYGRIGGVAVTITEAHTVHDVDAREGTARVVVPAPRPASLAYGAELEIEAGYPGAVHRIFHGFIPEHALAISDQGSWISVVGIGWASYLADPDQNGLTVGGPVSLKDFFRAVCAWREVPAYHSEETYLPSGNMVMLADNADVNGGAVVVDERTSPRTMCDRAAGLFGYRVYDRPDGWLWQSRVSGAPPTGSSVATYTEGVNCFSLGQSGSVRQTRNYWVAEGARYIDQDGVTLTIRSIADAIDPLDYLRPNLYRRGEINDGLLVTSELADAARNVAEIDWSGPQVSEDIETLGNPLLMPGSVVTVNSATAETIMQDRWAMRVAHDIDARGFTTTIGTWVGPGEALPAGDDCVTEDVAGGPWHMGNETISWYRSPSSLGETATITITVPYDDYTSLAVEGIAHGSNTYATAGRQRKTEPTTGSQIEVWQLPEPSQPATGDNEIRRVGTIELPTLDEEYRLRRNYASSDTYWTSFRLPMPGKLKQGAAELRLVAGDNETGLDDYELDDLRLTYCGVGHPDLPGTGA